MVTVTVVQFTCVLGSTDGCSSSIHIASDGKAIVCVHPLQQTPVESTKVSGERH